MAYGRHAEFDILRELVYTSVSSSYVSVGSPLAHEARMIQFVNSTDKDLYISVDGVNNHLRVLSGTVQPLDVCTNRISEDGFIIAVNTQFYVIVTTAGAPTKGSIAIQVIYAFPSP